MKAFVLALALAPACWSADGPVKAEWRKGVYSGPNQRWGCVDALFAVHDALEAAGARGVRAGCSGYYGLRAEWEALSPLKPDARLAALAGLLAGEERRFPGLSAAWERLGEPVSARWASARLFRQVSGQGCHAYSEAMDYMLTVLPVRNVSQSVFCDGGGGMIQVSFEYLEPEQSKGP